MQQNDLIAQLELKLQRNGGEAAHGFYVCQATFERVAARNLLNVKLGLSDVSHELQNGKQYLSENDW